MIREFDRGRIRAYLERWGHRGVSVSEVHGQVTTGKSPSLTAEEVRSGLEELTAAGGGTVVDVPRRNMRGATIRLYFAAPAAPEPVGKGERR